MSANADQNSNPTAATTAVPVPKRITNAQTVCNEKNAKGKLCNGHLKQLHTAGEPAKIHLRGDDVLFQCQTDGTLYMGPPLGHVRDPDKQSRFVEAELTALLQAAGGTMPVIKKDERGVFVMVESTPTHSTPSSAPPPKQTSAPATQTQAPAKAPTAPQPAATQKDAGHKTGAEPNRQLFKRSTYAGVKDTGPVAGETFEQKVARLKAVATAAKQRAEEGGGEVAPNADATQSTVDVAAPPAAEPPTTQPPSETNTGEVAASAPATTATHKPTGNADRTLMKRSTYVGVKDTGPVPGETFEQKVARLTALAAAAKQRSDGG